MAKRRIIAKPAKPIDALGTLGSILKDDELHNRDAVHIAVLPVTADHEMQPGDHIGLMRDGMCGSAEAEKKIGIVDPFLPREVRKDEHFYLFLYPRTITALQHHWQHPDVPDVSEVVTAADKAQSAQEAKLALLDYCSSGHQYGTPSYETLIRSAVDSLQYPDDYITILGEDANGSIPTEVLINLKIVMEDMGHNVPASWAPTHFSCSC